MSGLSLAAVVATAVLTGSTVLLLAALAVEHGRRGRRTARDAARRAELTPLVHAALDEEDEDDAAAELDRAPAPLDDLVLDLLPQLRGADRAALARLLVRRGVVARAAADLSARAAWRRGRAAALLGNAADPAHTPALTALLADPSAAVRCAAARALGKAGDPAAAGALLRTLSRSRPVPAGVVGMALLDLGTPVLPALREAAADPTAPGAQALAADLLGLHGDLQALDLLLDQATDRTRPVPVRCSAVTALGRLGSPSATPALATVLAAEGSPALRHAAAEALGRVGDDTALTALVTGLTAPATDAAVRASCADALAAAGEEGRDLLAAFAWHGGAVGRATRAALSNRARPREGRARTAA